MIRIDLVFRHEDADEGMAEGKTAVVIDVLRATTTITTALMNGAGAVLPVGTVEEAFALKAERGLPLAGERNGFIIEGFDFGNSPLEFTAQNVANRTIVFCTSNGTKAVNRAKNASACLLASLINAPAVARHVRRLGYDVLIICAGTLGKESPEDTVCGGLIADSLEGILSPSAEKARSYYLANRNRLTDCLMESYHGRELDRLGFRTDIIYASQKAMTETVPVLDGNLSVEYKGIPVVTALKK